MDIKEFRADIKDFVKWKLKSSMKPYQEQGKKLLALSDDELEEWRTANNVLSLYSLYVTKLALEKADKARYNRLKRKAEDMEIDEDFSESEEEFILSYEEEHNIKESILNL